MSLKAEGSILGIRYEQCYLRLRYSTINIKILKLYWFELIWVSCYPEVGTISKINEVYILDMNPQNPVSKYKIQQYGMGDQVTPGLVVVYKVDINKLRKNNCCVT